MAEPLPQKKQEAEETLQFLKREEVRTMAKDIALLREEEAKKEREHITKIKTGGPQPVQGLQVREAPPKPSLMPHTQAQKPIPVKAGTHSEKILIRAIVIGVLLFILLNGLTFGYWYFTRPTPPIEEAEEPLTQLIEPEDSSERPERPLVLTSLSFFEVAQEKTIDLTPTDNLPLLLSGVLKEEYPQGFIRILVRKTGDTAFLTTREFLNGTGVSMPEPLLSLLKEDFMLFVYSSPGRKRLGFVGELSQTAGVQDMLKAWETTLEQDTKNLWEIVGRKGVAYTPFFRQTAHQNNLVRFQTFSAIDFGIVYTLFGTRLILATSFESVTKAVDLLIQSRP